MERELALMSHLFVNYAFWKLKNILKKKIPL